MTLARALLAEAVFTALLTLATLGGALVSAGQGGLLAFSLIVCTALYLFISVAIPISGGHINPAVSLLFALRRDISIRRAAVYTCVQILGAIAAILLLHAIWGLELLQTGQTARNGAAHFASEVLASSGLALVITLGLRAAPTQVPVMVGGFAAIALWCLPSGGMQNPAVLIARVLTATPGGMRAEDLLPGIAAMAMGTLFGWALGTWLVADIPDQP